MVRGWMPTGPWLRGPDGNLVAVCRQRGRYVASGPDPAPISFDLPREVPDLATLIGFRPAPAGPSLTVAPVLENPMHNLHGGITLSVTDLAASLALTDCGPPLVTASLHVLYARPVPAGSTPRAGHRDAAPRTRSRLCRGDREHRRSALHDRLGDLAAGAMTWLPRTRLGPRLANGQAK